MSRMFHRVFAPAVMAFIACGSLTLLFILWTEYAYDKGFMAGAEWSAEASHQTQIN